MTIFQNILWGYEFTYPDSWIHQHIQETDIFLAASEGLDVLDSGLEPGQVQVRGEWNGDRRDIGPSWAQHIAKLASMLGAKEVGSAPWHLRDAVGLEAEIVLPKQDNRRLWTGILTRGFLVLHFMVTHPKEIREQFEPVATKLIKSLRFPTHIDGITTSLEGLPLPPEFTPADPRSILNDISDNQVWRAYTGAGEVGALQAFYVRELPIHQWHVDEYVPYPGASELGFARLRLHKADVRLTMGIMPAAASDAAAGSGQASVVFKISQP